MYTKSPARPLIGLDADDIMKLPGFDYDDAQFNAETKFVRAVEAAVIEKNK